MENLINKQKMFFKSGITKQIDYRIKALETLRDAIKNCEENIFSALKSDFRKPEFETYTTEILMLTEEINYLIKNIKKFSKPTVKKRYYKAMFGKSIIYKEPYGTALIISPWNYPLQLALSPVAGAIASGNTVILKPSELAPATSAILKKIIGDNFSEEYLSVMEGGSDLTDKLIAAKPDYIFFTGSVRVGKIIMEKAAKHLIPVTLELGGKSPCIVENPKDLKNTAERIIWGKLINCGQTCVAPDYLLVNAKIKDNLISELKMAIEKFYGKDQSKSPDYSRIISQNHFERLENLIKTSGGTISYGGNTDKNTRFISPTIIDTPAADSQIMNEEIFGPLIPIVSYDTIFDAIEIINAKPKPLALYIFAETRRTIQTVINAVSFGGGCVNNTIMHLITPELPFGGVGESGMGKYHGKDTFSTFTHEKSVLEFPKRLNMPFLFPPYKNHVKLMKALFK